MVPDIRRHGLIEVARKTGYNLIICLRGEVLQGSVGAWERTT